VQRQKNGLHAARGDFGQQRFREMQSGGRGRDGAGGPREDGLVSLAVLPIRFLSVARDIRRQGNLRPARRAGRRYSDAPVKRKRRCPHHSCQAPWRARRLAGRGCPGNDLAFPRAPVLPGRSMTHIVDGIFLEQQNLELPARMRIGRRGGGPGLRGESLRTKRSPRCKYSSRSRNRRCSSWPERRCKTNRTKTGHAAGAGACAISSGGNSKSKSAVASGDSIMPMCKC